MALEAAADTVVLGVRVGNGLGGGLLLRSRVKPAPASGPWGHNCFCTCIILSTLQPPGPALIWKHLPEHLFSSSINTLPKEGQLAKYYI